MIDTPMYKWFRHHLLSQYLITCSANSKPFRRQDISTGIKTKNVCKYGVCSKQPSLLTPQYADIIFHIVPLIINAYTKSDVPREPIIFLLVKQR